MVIERMNELLAEEDDRLTAHFGKPKLPVSYIFSQPRSASTLFTQVVFSAYRIGYASNLLSRFYRAPYIGAKLEAGIADPDHTSTYRTKHVTLGAHEPHEWGWFFRHWLGLAADEFYCPPNSPFDADGLGRKIAALESVFDAPMLFDSVFAMTNYDRTLQATPNALAVYVRRDPYYVCNSLINARLDRHGDLSAWYGQRPRNVQELLRIEDPVEQIAAQVKSIDDELERDLGGLDQRRVLRVDYDDLVERPLEQAARFASLLEQHGVDVTRRPVPEVSLRNRNVPANIRPEFKPRLDAAFERAFGFAHPHASEARYQEAVS